MPKPQASRTGNLHAGCGYIIERGARAGEVMGDDECAFTTYELIQSAGIGLSQPTVAFWGPRQTIAQHFGAATTTRYSFVGGVVFKNCMGQASASGASKG